MERGPPRDEEDHASPPVQAGIQEAQGCHVARRLDASQVRDQRAVCGAQNEN